jgi:hypothetical protein
MITHMNHRRVFERDISASRSFLVTETDMKAVESVGRFRLVLADQLLQLHWPKTSQRRHGESRLRGLFHCGWLDRLPLLDGYARPRAVYTLGSLGRSHVARTTGVPISMLGPRPAKERRHDLLFLQHHLMTVQAVINLELAARAAGGSLAEYKDERFLKTYRAKTDAIPIIPDAFVTLQINGRSQAFCIELDRATVDLRSWRARVQSYFHWTAMPSFTEPFRRPVALIVIDAEEKVAARRIAALKHLIEEMAKQVSADPSLFLLAPLSVTRSESLLGTPVWTVAGQHSLHPLMP